MINLVSWLISSVSIYPYIFFTHYHQKDKHILVCSLYFVIWLDWICPVICAHIDIVQNYICVLKFNEWSNNQQYNLDLVFAYPRTSIKQFPSLCSQYLSLQIKTSFNIELNTTAEFPYPSSGGGGGWGGRSEIV